jgi:RNA polymerase sigma-70 factor (ECF subfamily)
MDRAADHLRPETLLADTRWLRGIGRGIAGESAADDLKQETWLHARLRHGGRRKRLRSCGPRLVPPYDGPMGEPQSPTSIHVRQAVRGDQASLNWIVTRFSPLLRAQAAWRLGPRLRARVDPDDVVAEAWLVALRRLGDLVHDDGRSTPRFIAFLGTTILRIANRKIDEAVRQARVQAVEPGGSETPGVADDLAATVTGAVTNAARTELGAAIDRELAALSDRDREVILLRLVEGLSNEEAAAELGEAPNTVSHRYRRALAKLREALPESMLDDFVG